ncbi:MAG: GTP cyclohydrolase I FolE, partial [Okeania sp. SIO2D1]|nr:GTP cyclohydrolase I FolE [Okeania sp. SIO2D1]
MTQTFSNTSNDTISINGAKTSDAATNGISHRPDPSSSSNGQPIRQQPPAEETNEAMMEAVRTMLLSLGEDPKREGLLKTPKRVAEAMRFLTQG